MKVGTVAVHFPGSGNDGLRYPVHTEINIICKK